MATMLFRSLIKKIRSEEFQTHLLFYSLFGVASFLLVEFSDLLVKQEGLYLEIPMWLLVLGCMIFAVAVASVIWLAWSRAFRLERGLDLGAFQAAAEDAHEVFVLNTFVPEPERVAKILLDSAKKGAAVRVLMLGPYAKEAMFREATLPRKGAGIRKDIYATIEALEKEFNDFPKEASNIKIRLCSLWVPFSMYSTNKIAFVGFYFIGGLAVHGPQLIIRQKNPRHSDFIQQFEALWKDKTTSPDLSLHNFEGWRKQIHEYR
jgi:hypothetical protein